MQQTEANQKLKFPTDLERPIHPVSQDKGSIYGHEIGEERPRVSTAAPTRTHQQFVQRQQYYTGDA